MNPVKATDAIVDMDDALRWAEQLLHEPSENVFQRVFKSEPYVLGLAIDTANRATDRLRKRGVPEPILEVMQERIVIASAYSIELMQKGYRQLWNDFVEPGADQTPDLNNKGDDHV